MPSRRGPVARLRIVMLLASAAAWLVLLLPLGLVADHSAGAVHAVSHSSATAPTTAGLVAAHGTEWALMIAAMMAPALIDPIAYVQRQSLTSRRLRSTLAFLAGYGAVWMVLGGALLALLITIEVSSDQWQLTTIAVLVAGVVWQCSPMKQRCLNRCHARYALPAFGVAADLGACRFGAWHGIWCVGSCWALMLLPMLVPAGRGALMLLGALVVSSERLDQAAVPQWQWRGFGRVGRLVAARTRS
jgi:predicted metal-binding membrane protein